MRSYLGDYRELIGGFLHAGYRPVFFDALSGADGELLLRHDVDFDCGLARELSFVEDGMGVKSTWFFLLRSESYNPLSNENAAIIRSLRDRGHRVGLHFDPTLYGSVERGFAEEKAVFEGAFGMPLEIASIHRPNDFLKSCDAPICGVRHAYQPAYFKDIAYMADSQGRFRYGHPFESEAWKARKPIHLVVHPIWWTIPDAPDAVGALDRLVAGRTDAFRRHLAANCIPYKARLNV